VRALISARKIQAWLKSDKNNRHFTIRTKYMFDYCGY